MSGNGLNNGVNPNPGFKRDGTPQVRKGGPIYKTRALIKNLKLDNARFFAEMLDDEQEQRIWQWFLTGKLQMGKERKENPATGEKEWTPIYEFVEFPPFAFAAFKLAVAYKRGQPIAMVATGEETKNVMIVQVENMGAGPEFFANQAKNMGLLPRAKDIDSEKV